jgi:hypothetical protein
MDKEYNFGKKVSTKGEKFKTLPEELKELVGATEILVNFKFKDDKPTGLDVKVLRPIVKKY